MSSSSSQISNISDTAHLVAMYRALETDRPDALFQDRFARLLAGGKGELLMEVLGDKRHGTNAIAVRTRVIDELIEQLVKVQGIDTILNLACGLDTRPYRLSLPSELHWIEVDLPDILSYKAEKLQNQQPNCLLERVALDLCDLTKRKALFSKVNTQGLQVLIISEGLLGYLPPPQVTSLAANLHEQSNFRWWLFELLPPAALQTPQSHQLHKKFDQYFANGNATRLFAPEEGADFFCQYGWNVALLKSFWVESRRLHRQIPLAWLWELSFRWFAQKRWQSLNKQDAIVLLQAGGVGIAHPTPYT